MRLVSEEGSFLVITGKITILSPQQFNFDEDFADIVGERGALTMFWAGDSKKHFARKVEKKDSLGMVEIHWFTSEKNLTAAQILAELRGEKSAVFSLGEVYDLLKFHSVGGEDILCTEKGNLFFVYNSQRNLVVMNIYLHKDSSTWIISVCEASSPHQWQAGHRVYSLPIG